MRTRDKHKEALVRQKTMEFLVKEGLEGFSVNKIAKECGISVRTLYIYYKDSDDLIIQIAKEEVAKMEGILLDGFDPVWSFEKGLAWMWKRRARYMLDNETGIRFTDLLRHSTYRERVFGDSIHRFQTTMEQFIKNAIRKKEVAPLSFEMLWSLAFAPLHSLIAMHNQGKEIEGKKFQLTPKILDEAFEKVMKGIRR